MKYILGSNKFSKVKVMKLLESIVEIDNCHIDNMSSNDNGAGVYSINSNVTI